MALEDCGIDLYFPFARQRFVSSGHCLSLYLTIAAMEQQKDSHPKSVDLRSAAKRQLNSSGGRPKRL